jgi:hypothetical protein
LLGQSTLQKRWVIAYRYADVPQKRPRSRLTLDYNVNESFQLGLEYNFLVKELGFRSSLILLQESARTPQVHLNTSSDRIGTPEGYQQVSLSIAKTIPETPVAPYVSLTYSGFNKKFLLPFGMNVDLHPQWNLLYMYDGRKSHVLVTFATKELYLQGGLVWLKHPLITIGTGF